MLYPRAQADQVIQRLLNRFRRIGTVIKEAENMGLAVERQPYTEYLREIETTGFRRVTLYSVARFSSGKLADVHLLRISGQFSVRESGCQSARHCSLCFRRCDISFPNAGRRMIIEGASRNAEPLTGCIPNTWSL